MPKFGSLIKTNVLSSYMNYIPDHSGQHSVVAADTRFGQRDLDPQESSKETGPL